MRWTSGINKGLKTKRWGDGVGCNVGHSLLPIMLVRGWNGGRRGGERSYLLPCQAKQRRCKKVLRQEDYSTSSPQPWLKSCCFSIDLLFPKKCVICFQGHTKLIYFRAESQKRSYLDTGSRVCVPFEQVLPLMMLKIHENWILTHGEVSRIPTSHIH